MGKEIALFCTLHPVSTEKRTRCLDLLRKSAREYYRRPSAKCTTWSYFTVSPLLKSSDPTVCGLEMYTDSQSLTDQLNDPVYFQSYHEITKREGLYSKPEDLVAWYHSGGFVARGTNAIPFGGVVVSCTTLTCKDRGLTMEKLTQFSEWVKNNEPDVLTYAIFTRPKAPKDLFLFVRYKDGRALQGHSKAPEHVAILHELADQVDDDVAKSTTLWQEVEDSFVSTALGGADPGPSPSKL